MDTAFQSRLVVVCKCSAYPLMVLICVSKRTQTEGQFSNYAVLRKISLAIYAEQQNNQNFEALLAVSSRN